MKLVSSVLLTLSFSIAVPAQTKEMLRLKSELEFAGPEKDSIVAHKLLEDGRKLVLVGKKNDQGNRHHDRYVRSHAPDQHP